MADVTIKLDGKEYAVDDFEGRELLDAERTFGISLVTALNDMSMTGIYALLYLVKKRENARFTLEDALALKLGDVQKMIETDDEEEDGEVPPPNRAARRAKKPASTAAASGAPNS